MVRKEFPALQITADAKIMDAGEYEAAPVAFAQAPTSQR